MESNYKETKKNYLRILDETIDQTEKFVRKFPEIDMYSSILNQLKDIKKRIKQGNLLNKKQAFDTYNFGAIGAKNFENSKYGNHLMFLFGLSYEFNRLPNE